MSNDIDDIFGEPALVGNENRQAYQRLYAAIEADIQPKNFFDRLQVRERTDKIWEELRLKKNCTALIDSRRVEALAELLQPIMWHTAGTLAMLTMARNLGLFKGEALEDNEEAFEKEDLQDDAEALEDGEEELQDDEEELEDDEEEEYVPRFVTAREYAEAYFGTEPKGKLEAAKMMASYGITEEMVYARAMQLSAEPLRIFDRMIVNRENLRRHL